MKLLLLRHHEYNVDAFEPFWTGSLGDAKKAAKNVVPKGLRDVIIVEEFDVKTDKASIVEALNGEPVHDKKPLRVWGITPRGSLKEETGE